MCKTNNLRQSLTTAATRSSVALLLLFSLIAASAVSARAATPWYAEGSSHTLALMKDGTVWAVGSNSYGQLGNGGSSWWRTSSEPQHVTGLNHVIAVAAGGAHSAALKDDGTVWVWGYNGAGQLGNTRQEFSSVPVQVAGLSGVKAIASGISHLVALKNDGTIWAWGSNRVGQLGNDHDLAIICKPVQVAELHGMASIAAGGYHTVALQQNGRVWSWGYDSNGALGNGTVSDSGTHLPAQVSSLSDVKAVAAGLNHSVAIREDGTVWVWGSNRAGQQGNGTTAGANNLPVQLAGVSGVADVIAKANHTVALMQDGTAWAWGDKGSGQWGNGFTVDGSSTPVQMRGASGATAVAALVNPGSMPQPGDTLLAKAEREGSRGTEESAALQTSPAAGVKFAVASADTRYDAQH
jgi:alpha-tubulin suppressor-like RCC1 family protein